MKIISEITGLQYDTVEQCLDAEEKFKAEYEARERANEAFLKEKNVRREEIQNLRNKALEARQEYLEKREKYFVDYGEEYEVSVPIIMERLCKTFLS